MWGKSTFQMIYITSHVKHSHPIFIESVPTNGKVGGVVKWYRHRGD
jgi:hypothetical protein